MMAQSVFLDDKVATDLLMAMLHAIYKLCIENKKITTVQLQRELDVNYRTAWLIRHRIREAFKGRKYGDKAESDLFEWSKEEDKILLDNWKKGAEVEKNLKRTLEEIEQRLEILFEKYEDGVIPD